MSQITTITFFKYTDLSKKVWAFTMMQSAHQFLSKVPGLPFYKLMGSGKGYGFNPLPDWSVYALLQVWQSEEEAMLFFNKHQLMKKYQEKASHVWTIFMKSIMAKGEWSGNIPFVPHSNLNDQNKCIAVITRATIKWSKMAKFWRFVPKSQRPLIDAYGLLYTKGVGEAPLVQMATFSLWASEEDLQQFAYGSKEHKKAIQLTRSLGWYKEELFARFQPYISAGTWENGNPLSNQSGIAIINL